MCVWLYATLGCQLLEKASNLLGSESAATVLGTFCELVLFKNVLPFYKPINYVALTLSIILTLVPTLTLSLALKLSLILTRYKFTKYAALFINFANLQNIPLFVIPCHCCVTVVGRFLGSYVGSTYVSLIYLQSRMKKWRTAGLAVVSIETLICDMCSLFKTLIIFFLSSLPLI